MELEKIVAERLAKPNKTIAEHTNEVVDQLNTLHDLGYIPNHKIYELTKKACELHDIGKINNEFQSRVEEKKEKKSFNPQTEIAHNVLSAFLIDPKQFEEKSDYYKILFAVLYHHHYGNALEDIKNKSKLIKDLLKDFTTYNLKTSAIQGTNILMEEKDTETVWIKGLLHKCDYSASAGYPIELPNHFLISCLEKQLSEWKEKKHTAEWNELQQFCMKNQNKNIVGIAQTGMGKTEGGLLWIGDNKGFFILPIRTAINAIYERVANNLLNNQDVLDKVGIMYSDSLEYYMKNVEEESEKLLEYEQRGKALSLPLSIATLDQLFDFVLKYPAYELKLATLAYSKVVIDEIQMYDPNLLAYLIHGIKMIDKMGGKIAILTATFSPFLRKLLAPVEFEEAKFMDESKRHHVKVLNREMNTKDIYDYYLENKSKADSCKVLVICNTIKKAQKIYEEFKEYGEIEELHILHSMFIKKDRAEIEAEILRFGKTFHEDGNMNNDFGIWISTPLVEASLDIDFDILFTELKEISSLFQRFGRCNRKGEKLTDKVNCFVYTQVDYIKNGKKGFIDREIYELSKKALEHVSGILSEQRKVELIEEYFTFENLKNSDYMREYKTTLTYLESLNNYEESKDKINLRNILSEDVIPYSIYEEHMEEIRECERKLKEKSITKLERLKLRDCISQYTVSVPLYKVKNYEKAIRKSLANRYEGVHISQYRTIKIMECYYDEMGFKEIDYQNYIRTPNIM